MSDLLLAIDLGNTTIQAGIFETQDLIGEWRFSTKRENTADELGLMFLNALNSKGISANSIEGIIISSVLPSLKHNLKHLCSKYFDCSPIEIDPGREEYLPVTYPNPKEIGADRIVNAVAACEKYGAPLIIIDFGTATTFCAISPKGEFMGGCIVPGIGISQETLIRRAECLSPVSWERPRNIIAKSTGEAIRSGLLFGYSSLVDGIVKRMRKSMEGDPKVIATGGWANIIMNETESINIIDPYLTLEGLRIIYERKRKSFNP